MNRTQLLTPFKSANFLMFAAMLSVGVANITWAEQLTVNGGFGWDGLRYADWTRDFYHSIFVARAPEYYVRRILPSAIVHYGMRLFGVSRTDPNIIQGFQVYNLILSLVAVYGWGLTANLLKISTRGKWLGFCFLFLNYAILKHNVYHAVLTDTSAFTLGVLMFYFFLSDNRIGMLAVILAGTFVWPTLPYMAALMFVFPYQKENVLYNGTIKSRRSKLPTLFALFACFVTILCYAYLLRPQLFPVLISKLNRMLRIDMPLIYLSLAAVILYVFLSVRAATDPRLFNFRHVLRALRWRRAVVIVLVLGLLNTSIKWVESGEYVGWNLKAFAGHTFLAALTEPMIFLVAHTVYYGPFILLLVLFWGSFCDNFCEYGLGASSFLILNVLLSINPQSRFQITVVPAFAAVLVQLLDRAGLTYRFVVFIGVLCVFYSKVWYVFNTAPQIDDGTMHALQTFPLQHLFMGSGPWMSHDMYLVQGGVVLCTGILLYFVLSRNLLDIGFGQSNRVRGQWNPPKHSHEEDPIGGAV